MNANQSPSIWATRPEPQAKPQHVSRQGRKTVVVKPEPTTAESINQWLKRHKACRG